MSFAYSTEQVLQTNVGRCSLCTAPTIGILVERKPHREWLVSEWDGRLQRYVPHECAPAAA